MIYIVIHIDFPSSMREVFNAMVLDLKRVTRIQPIPKISHLENFSRARASASYFPPFIIHLLSGPTIVFVTGSLDDRFPCQSGLASPDGLDREIGLKDQLRLIRVQETICSAYLSSLLLIFA